MPPRLPFRVQGIVALLLLVVGISVQPRVGDDAHRAYAGMFPANQQPSVATAIVDSGQPQQVMEGFGATTQSLVYGVRDNITPSLRRRAIEAVYGQVRLTMGTTDSLVETPSGRAGGTNDDPTARFIDWAGFYTPAKNDNPDPNIIEWSGFNDVFVRPIKEKVIDQALPLGFDNFMPGRTINTRRVSPWLSHLRATNYSAYIAEAAEQALATQLYWRDQWGLVPRYHLLFNEPLSGNRELAGGTPQDIVEIVKRAGTVLRAAGFPDVMFVVPSDETEEHSLETARAVLRDPEARQYVGAIAYHPYPYGSIYSSVPRILATSGAGRPDQSRVNVRRAIRDLTIQYGVSAWMTEVSNGEVHALSYESFLGRAIHIHDELRYANASAYFGMNSIMDRTTQEDHFRGRNVDLFDADGTIVIIDNPADAVYITGMGRAIGHFARWLTRGTVRVQSDSSDPQVLVSTFRDDAQATLILVLINSAPIDKRILVTLQGITVGSGGIGEQTTPSGYWQPLADLQVADPSHVEIVLPGSSVTSLAYPFLPTSAAVEIPGR